MTVSFLKEVTWADFQSWGSRPESSDLVNNIDRGIHISSAVSLRTSGGQPSTPGDLAGLTFHKLLLGVIFTVSKGGTVAAIEQDGISDKFSCVNTLVKNLLSTSALSLFVCAVKLSEH